MDDLKKHQSVMLELLGEFDRVCKKHNIKYVLFAGSALGAVRHHGFIPWDDDMDVALLRSEYEKLMNLAQSEWDGKYYFQKEFSEHWSMYFSKLRKNNTACIEKYHPKDQQTHQGIYIDVFPIDNAYRNPMMQRLQFFASRIVMAKVFYRRGYETNSFLKKVFICFCRILPMTFFKKLVQYNGGTNSENVHSFLGGTSSYKKGCYQRKWFTEQQIVTFEGRQVPISAYADEMLTAMYGDYMKLPSEKERMVKEHAMLVDTNNSYEKYVEWQAKQKIKQYTRSIR